MLAGARPHTGQRLSGGKGTSVILEISIEKGFAAILGAGRRAKVVMGLSEGQEHVA